MVEEGHITQEEADQLIAVLREVDAAGERLAAAGAAGTGDADLPAAAGGGSEAQPARDTAETAEAATAAVKALADAFNAGGGNGNNHIPEDGKPVTDAVAEAHREIGVTA